MKAGFFLKWVFSSHLCLYFLFVPSSCVTEAPTPGGLGTCFSNTFFRYLTARAHEGTPLLPRALSLEWQGASDRVDRPQQSSYGMASQVGLFI